MYRYINDLIYELLWLSCSYIYRMESQSCDLAEPLKFLILMVVTPFNETYVAIQL